jgi:hypothetical protein
MSENWHKRHALSLASQLPENASDANAVIRELQHLVDSWLHPASFDGIGGEALRCSPLRTVPRRRIAQGLIRT